MSSQIKSNLIFATIAIFQFIGCNAFSPSSNVRLVGNFARRLDHPPNFVVSSTTLKIFPDEQSSILLSSAEGWRQYVPLAVSCGVILDILLGSPIANLALGPMRRAAEDASDEDSAGGASNGKEFVKNPKERVDSEMVAQAAIDRARNSMELRRYLEENKTDAQKFEDMKKELDKQADQFDSKMLGD
mmetsp:Transcript_204/g.270  ORF Transcript_204/g.270 Transcript_204/m.270 type:complete len:187 (-) Transcript_204:195-755(-)